VSAIEPVWARKERRLLYEGRMTIAEYSAVLPGGGETSYEVDESLEFAVAVLVQRPDDQIVLTRQFRFPLDRWIYDLPGGGGKPGETPQDAARRECQEETGLIAHGLTHLHSFYSNPGRTGWPTHLYFCSGTSQGVADDSDPSESVRIAPMSVKEIDELILDGSIVDPALLIGRFVAAAHGLIGAPVSGPSAK
jgi:ADP-ribose pyrophosphatase